MDLPVLIAFVAVAATLIVLPGPDWALVIAAGSRARGVVLPTVAGLAIGYTLITCVVAVGVAPIVAAAPLALVVLTVAGAGYLIYLGLGILRRPSSAPEMAEAPNATPGRVVLRGVGVSALNPKSLLFFLAFLPQFTRPSAAWPVGIQLMVLGGVWITLGATFYTVLGLTAESTLARRPTLARAITRVAGAAMVLAGIALLAEQLIHRFGTTP
jgi:threonine/homoserine/homoserine lactone efflux protein